MAAYELAVVQEHAGNREQAIEWYTVAVQRFRRQEWKKKAEDALVRLGAPVPATSDPASASDPGPRESSEPASLSPSGDAGAAEPPADEFKLAEQKTEPTLFGLGDFNSHEEPADASPAADAQAKPTAAAGPDGLRRKRRRGRRGGRGRRRKPGTAALAPGATAAPTTAATTARIPAAAAAHQAPEEEALPRATPFAVPPPRREAPVSFLRDPDSEPAATPFLPRGRPGDPALSSRLAPLESQLRRLLAAAPSPVEEAPGAPAGPGVFLLSDSDQTTYYYIEACQTLRIGIANLLRTASRGRGPAVQGDPVRTRLAEHLGITAAKAPKYLKDYCVVRWLQLDEGAPHLAHFAIAILKPALND